MKIKEVLYNNVWIAQKNDYFCSKKTMKSEEIFAAAIEVEFPWFIKLVKLEV